MPSPGETILDKQTIRLDERTGQILQGIQPLLDLAPLERSLLRYFLAKPQVSLTKSEIINNTWPAEVHRDGVSDDALYQLICSTRRKLQCGPFAHCNYIRNWRSSRDEPEGGYRFYPDGQPSTQTESIEVPWANQLLESVTQQQKLLEQLSAKTEHLIQNLNNGHEPGSHKIELNGKRPIINQQSEPLIQGFSISNGFILQYIVYCAAIPSQKSQHK